MGWGIHRSNGPRSIGWTFAWTKELRLNRTWKIILSIVMISVVLLLFFVTMGAENDQHVEDRLAAALDSMAQTDEDQWQSLIHPEYGSHLMDLDALKDKFKIAHVVIGQSWDFNGKIDCTNETYKGLDAVRITCRIRIGPTKEYSVIAIYIVDEPEGFVEFNVYAV